MSAAGESSRRTWDMGITRAEFLGDGSSSSSLRSDMIEKAEMAFNLMDRYLLFKVTGSQ